MYGQFFILSAVRTGREKIYFGGYGMNTMSDREILDRIHKGVTEGVRKAVLEHKKAGRSISVWRNGRVEEIPPDKIDVNEKD